MLISENILSKSVLKPKLGYLPILVAAGESQDPGEVGTLALQRKNIAANGGTTAFPARPVPTGFPHP